MAYFVIFESINDTSCSKKKITDPRGGKPMTFCSPTGRSTTELQETQCELGHITRHIEAPFSGLTVWQISR